MSANIENLVIIVQPIDLQQLIWQRLLEFQDISVIPVSPETNLLSLLNQKEKTGQPLPKMLLIDQQLPNWNWETFCQSCQQEYPDVDVILLSRDSDTVPPLQRQAALQAGAIEVLPAFSISTLALDGVMSFALDAIKALKPILASLGKVKQNDALATSIINLKREIESLREEKASSTVSPEIESKNYPNLVQSSTEPSNEPSTEPSNEPSKVSPPETKTRTYRGRTY